MLAAVVCCSKQESRKPLTGPRARYPTLPLSFEANLGQTDRAVRFLARGRGYGLFLTPAETVLTLAVGQDPTSLRMRFSGANPHPDVIGQDTLASRTNYFLGNDPSKWQTDVPNYAKVRYRDMYPGIDLVYYGNNGRLEYDFIVAPGANPRDIRLSFDVDSRAVIDRNGDLLIQSDDGPEIRMHKPVAYQKRFGMRRNVRAGFAWSTEHELAFEVGAYDQREPLVIDPVLTYSTYLGGNFDDTGYAVAVDGSGNAYIAGSTLSLNFPTSNALQGSKAIGTDAFVTKFNASGSAFIYSTYLGGTGFDTAYGISVDGGGNAYLIGTTASMNFPTAGSLQSYGGGPHDAFVTKLNVAGSALSYSTYIGGSSDEQGYAIALDGSGNVYGAGATTSSNFPTVNPVQAMLGDGGDAFVFKLNAGGSALVYSTYLGGTDNGDFATGIAVDGSGSAYVTGYTYSTNFPTVNALQPTYGGGGSDAFVAKFSASGSSLVYSTYLGGFGFDAAYAIAVDGSGNAHVTGATSANFSALVNGVKPAGSLVPAYNAFVIKLNSAGSGLLYSTYFTGTDEDWGQSIALDASGNTFVTGHTDSSDFPVRNALQPAFGGEEDVFIAKLNPEGVVLYATYLGGTDADTGYGIAVDGAGAAYVTGTTTSTDFPTANPKQAASGGPDDVFLSKISVPAAPAPSLGSVTPSFAAQGATLSISLTGTNFDPTWTVVDVSGSGVVVSNIAIAGATSLTATLTIDAAADPGARSLTVVTPNAVSNAVTFTIQKKGRGQIVIN